MDQTEPNIEQPTTSARPKVKITGGPVSNNVALTIDGVIVPFYSAAIHLRAGELVTITAQIPADMVDIEALEKDTELKLIKTEDAPKE